MGGMQGGWLRACLGLRAIREGRFTVEGLAFRLEGSGALYRTHCIVYL